MKIMHEFDYSGPYFRRHPECDVPNFKGKNKHCRRKERRHFPRTSAADEWTNEWIMFHGFIHSTEKSDAERETPPRAPAPAPAGEDKAYVYIDVRPKLGLWRNKKFFCHSGATWLIKIETSHFNQHPKSASHAHKSTRNHGKCRPDAEPSASSGLTESPQQTRCHVVARVKFSKSCVCGGVTWFFLWKKKNKKNKKQLDLLYFIQLWWKIPWEVVLFF